MNWSDITSGYGSQSFRPIGGLLGLNLGSMQQQLPPQFAQLFGNGGMQSQFPQYGGNTRSAQMMNNYMGGLLSRRQGYMPPQMAARQQPAAAPASAASNAGTFYWNANNGNWWDAVPGAYGPAGNAGPA
jgi:hypothetical protein